MSWRGAGLEEGLVWEGQSGDPLVPAVGSHEVHRTAGRTVVP